MFSLVLNFLILNFCRMFIELKTFLFNQKMKFAPQCLPRAPLNNCSIFSIAFSPFFALQFPILIIFYAIFHFTTFTLFMQISAKCYLNLAKRITVTRLSTPKPWFRASSLLSVSCENRYDYDSRCRSGRHVEQMKKLITHQVAEGWGGRGGNVCGERAGGEGAG